MGWVFLLGHGQARMPGVHGLGHMQGAQGMGGQQDRAHAMIFRAEVMRAGAPGAVGLGGLEHDLLRALPGEAFDLAGLGLEVIGVDVEQGHVFLGPQPRRVDAGGAPGDEAAGVELQTPGMRSLARER
jgi:hypothetical protein